MQTGIYRIRNTKNGKCYIGSCASVKGFSTRWSKHRKQLERQEHHSPILQNAWNKYSADAFVFEILEVCKPVLCIQRKQIYLDQEQPEYNICKIAGSCLGVKRSDEFKEMVRRTSTGRRHSDETKAKLSRMKLGNRSRTGMKHTTTTLIKMSERQRGVNNPSSKLAELDVIEIRGLLDQDVPQQKIADRYKVSRSMISNIKRGHSWRHV